MSKNALIVDDSRLACKIMSNMLDTIGIDSASVYSAEEALEYLKHTLPDVVFLDHTMPGMSGLELIKLIKSNPHTATLPVMMYTAKQGEVYVGQARALGAVDVLPKGMEKNYLVNALVKLGLISDANTVDSTADVENTIGDEISKSDEKKEFIERRKFNRNDFEKPLLENEPDWKIFWQIRVEPFLQKLRQTQSDEIRESSSQQTFKLTREIHQTLENFEHALIARIEAHDDYKDTKRQIEKKHTRKIIYWITAFVVILQLNIFWQLLENNRIDAELLVAQTQQQKWNKQYDEQLLQLNQKLEPIIKAQTNAREQPLNEVTNTISLVDEYGGIVVQNLYLNDSETNEYLGVTSSGYQILVNLQGEVGWQLNNRFYQSNDCEGDAFVRSESAIVYRTKSSEIWFVDKLALEIEIQVASKLNEDDECELTTGEVLMLRPIERDYNLATGIDETQDLLLIIGE